MLSQQLIQILRHWNNISMLMKSEWKTGYKTNGMMRLYFLSYDIKKKKFFLKSDVFMKDYRNNQG